MPNITPRKTIEVELLRTMANRFLAADGPSIDNRLGVASLLEQALHLSGNYKGFRYLTQDEVPTGALPGIERTFPANTFPDESRRYYH